MQEVEGHLTQHGEIHADIWKLGVNTALRISELLLLMLGDNRASVRAVTD